MRISDLLRSLDVGGIQADLRQLFTRIDDNFQVLKRALNSQITLSDNIRCDIITARFDSGVPLGVKLKNLQIARSGIVLGSSTPVFCAPEVRPGNGGASITLRFAQNAKSVLATVVLFEEGTSSGPGSLIATANAPGLVRPDGTTITVDSAGVIHGSAPSAPSAWHPATPPSVADSRDEEFSGADTIGSTWSSYAGATLTPHAIAPFTSPPVATGYYSWNAAFSGGRPGSLAFQSKSDNTAYGIFKTVALGATEFIYTIFSSESHGQQYSSSAMLYLLSSGGQYVYIRWQGANISGDGHLLAGSDTTASTHEMQGPFRPGTGDYPQPGLVCGMGLMKVPNGANEDWYWALCSSWGNWFIHATPLRTGANTLFNSTKVHLLSSNATAFATYWPKTTFKGLRFRADGSTP